MTARQWEQQLGPESKAAKWNAAIIHLLFTPLLLRLHEHKVQTAKWYKNTSGEQVRASEHIILSATHTHTVCTVCKMAVCGEHTKMIHTIL